MTPPSGSPPPPLDATTRHPRTLGAQLVATVNGGAQITAVSQHITFPFTIRHIQLTFPPGCDNLVRATPMLCSDPSAPTDRLPPGHFLLAQISPTIYVIGEDTSFGFPLNHRRESLGAWLKLHLDNRDIQPHTVTLFFSVQELLTEDL